METWYLENTLYVFIRSIFNIYCRVTFLNLQFTKYNDAWATPQNN